MNRDKKRKQSQTQMISPEWPFWYQPHSPLGSAVRYISSLSPQFKWVGIYIQKKSISKLGPSLGAQNQPSNSSHMEIIRDSANHVLGQIEIHLGASAQEMTAELNAVRQVAQELGQLGSFSKEPL